MSANLHQAGDSGGSRATAEGYNYYSAQGDLNYNSTISWNALKVYNDCTLSGMFIRLGGGGCGLQDCTVYLYKNGAAGNQTVTIPALSSGTFQDVVNSDNLVSGDIYQPVINVPIGGVVTIVVASFKSVMTNAYSILGVGFQKIFLPSALYHPIGGGGSSSSVESYAFYTIRTSTTLDKFRVYVSSNTCDANNIFYTRINGVNGNLTVTVIAGTTGEFADTVNSDSIAVGDNLNFISSGSGAGSGYTEVIQIRSNSAGRQLICTGGPEKTLAFSDTDCRLNVEGYLGIGSATISKSICQTNFTAKNSLVNVTANTLDGASTLTVRKNDSDTTIVATIPLGTTGIFEDTANTVDFVSTDYICYKVACSGTAGTMKIYLLGVEIDQPAGAPGTPKVSAAIKLMSGGFI
jgi:hypothetical protein